MPRKTRGQGIGQGPAKGPGNGSPKAPPLDTSPEKQRERATKTWSSVKEKMRAWREAHPEWADEHVMSRSEASEYAQSRIRPAIDQITQRLHQTQNDAVVAALAKELRELAYGKDAQALTLQHSTGPTVQIYIPGNDRDPETAAGAAGEIPKQSR